MKKIYIFILLMMCLVLSSCDNTSGPSTIIEELDTPVLSYDPSTGIASWQNVDNATHYNYIINNEEILTTTSLSIQLFDKQNISVQAANNETTSEWSYAVTCFDTSDIYQEIVNDVLVKFHNTNLETIKMLPGEKVNQPIAPTKEYYTFDNWYSDPYYTEVFDFNQPIYTSTIIYANYIPNDLLANTYFWVKGDPKMTATTMSSGTGSNWHFIPLKLNDRNTSYKEFMTTVTVTGASSSNPCCFIVMDGFSDDEGRTYWKNNDSDFSITENGTYNIYFSVEYQYSENINVKFEKTNNTAVSIVYKNNNLTLDTPLISIDPVNNIATWNEVRKAIKYEVIIDNGEVIETSDTSIQLDKGSFITVRAISNEKYSRWSVPKANIRHILVGDTTNSYSVYFVGYEAYQVNVNESVIAPNDLIKESFTFAGWYLDITCTKQAQFPYTITDNTVFYPKWVSIDDYENKVYYYLTLSDGTIVSQLTWNLDNYTFDEYQTPTLKLTKDTEYYIVSTSDENVKYGPYKVNTTGGYTIYFSEDHLWDDINVYFASSIKTYYFSCPTGWNDTVYAYIWNSKTNDIYKYWPGSEMTYVETNDYGEKIYKIDIDTTLYDYIIFTHGSNGQATGSQSVDILLTSTSKNGFYLTQKNSNGKYEYGTYQR